jgi:hypothetical protein
MWNNTDTTKDGVNYLPMLLTESSEVYFYKPKSNKTIINRAAHVQILWPKDYEFVQDMYRRTSTTITWSFWTVVFPVR